MRVSVVLEHRFIRTPDRNVWTDGPFPYSFFTRYLTTFDGVSVVARVGEANTPRVNWRRAGGEGVCFSSIPYYVGPGQYLRRAPQVRSRARQAVGRWEAVILRVPSQVAICAESALHSANRPYAVEVVGDPHDAFSPGTGLHPLRGLFRWRHGRRLKDQCAGACAAAYVTGGDTEKTLSTRARNVHGYLFERRAARGIPRRPASRCSPSEAFISAYQRWLARSPIQSSRCAHRRGRRMRAARVGSRTRPRWGRPAAGGARTPRRLSRVSKANSLPGTVAVWRGRRRRARSRRPVRPSLPPGGTPTGDDRGHGARAALRRVKGWRDSGTAGSNRLGRR